MKYSFLKSAFCLWLFIFYPTHQHRLFWQNQKSSNFENIKSSRDVVNEFVISTSLTFKTYSDWRIVFLGVFLRNSCKSETKTSWESQTMKEGRLGRRTLTKREHDFCAFKIQFALGQGLGKFSLFLSREDLACFLTFSVILLELGNKVTTLKTLSQSFCYSSYYSNQLLFSSSSSSASSSSATTTLPRFPFSSIQPAIQLSVKETIYPYLRNIVFME